VQTDISDFYPRIYHHRIENALQRLPGVGDQPKRVMDLLKQFSQNVSYGLPVGGPASRILAELSLDGVDKLLIRRGVRFCLGLSDTCPCARRSTESYRPEGRCRTSLEGGNRGACGGGALPGRGAMAIRTAPLVCGRERRRWAICQSCCRWPR